MNLRRTLYLLIICLIVVGLTAPLWRKKNVPDVLATPETPHPRIVSLAPATTETLCMLGLEKHLVGISRFCDFPPTIADLPRVGGLTDVDIEAIVRLEPDLVVAPRPQLRARETLAKLGIDVLTVDQETLPQIYDSVWIIGEALDRSEVAAAWLAEIDAIMATAGADKLPEEEQPTVLISVGRDPASFERVYIAGRDTFYEQALEAVGARNAYRGSTPYPMLSAEGIVLLNPDIIIDIIPATGDEEPSSDSTSAAAQWGTIPGLRAVDAGRVHVITETWAVRPGPRIGFLIQRLAEITAPK